MTMSDEPTATAVDDDDTLEAGEEELLAFGWAPGALPDGQAALLQDGLAAHRGASGWIVTAALGGATLGRFPTASAVRRYARRLRDVADWAAAPAAGLPGETIEAARLLALAVIEDELAVMRETMAALEAAILDASERVDDIQAKAILSADVSADPEDSAG